jgi:hypothetical protein
MEGNSGLTGFSLRISWFLSITRRGVIIEFVRFMVDCKVSYGG